jgi:hypothetical protein
MSGRGQTILRLPGISCGFQVARAGTPTTRIWFEIDPGHGSPAQTALYEKLIVVETGTINLGGVDK